MYPVTRPDVVKVTPACPSGTSRVNHSPPQEPHRSTSSSGAVARRREVGASRSAVTLPMRSPNFQFEHWSTNMILHTPKGPNGSYKTGQRVPETGTWVDQHGVPTHHERGATFPPCIDRKGECAYRVLAQAAATA